MAQIVPALYSIYIFTVNYFIYYFMSLYINKFNYY